jgi:hypothetical protein
MQFKIGQHVLVTTNKRHKIETLQFPGTVLHAFATYGIEQYIVEVEKEPEIGHYVNCHPDKQRLGYLFSAKELTSIRGLNLELI